MENYELTSRIRFNGLATELGQLTQRRNRALKLVMATANAGRPLKDQLRALRISEEYLDHINKAIMATASQMATLQFNLPIQ